MPKHLFRVRAIFERTKGAKNVRKIVRRFSRSTKIFYDSPVHFIEKLFWAVVYLSGFILIALTCNDLYQTYENCPVLISNLNMHNESIKLPDATICLPYFHAANRMLHQENLFIINGEFSRFDYKEIAEFEAKFYVNEMERFFENFTTWQEMTEVYWPGNVLYPSQTYLSFFYETESLVSGNGRNPLKDTFSVTNETDNVLLAVVTVLKPKLVEWNVTIGKFRDTFALKFREFYSMYVMFVSENGLRKEMTKFSFSQEVVFITKNQVCYQLKLNRAPFIPGSSIEIVIDTKNLLSESVFGSCDYNALNFIYKPCHTWTVGDEPVTVDFNGKARAGSINREFDNVFLAGFGTTTASVTGNTILAINPMVQYISVPLLKGIPRCSENTTAEDCQRNCRNEIIQKQCNCSAIMSQPITYDMFCTFAQYEMCMLNFTGSEDINCSSQCLESCTFWQYNVKKPSANQFIGNWSDNTISIIQIQVSSFDYQILQESADWSFVTIIGVIGGALQFWLGLDIITIVYIILVTPLLYLIDKKMPKKIASIEIATNCSEAVVQDKQQVSWNLKSVIKNEMKLKTWDIHDPEFLKSAVRKLIWSVLFLVGASLTIHMFVELCQQYERRGTNSNVTVIINKTMKLPPSVVCFPTTTFVNAVDFNHELPTFLYFIKQTNLTRETLLGNYTWPPSVTFVAFLYLDATSDMAGGMQYMPYDSTANSLYLMSLHNLMFRLSVSYEELQQKFGLEYTNMMNITAFCDCSFENLRYPLTAMATIEKMAKGGNNGFYPTSICLHFPMENFTFRSADDRCSIAVGASKLNSNFTEHDYWYWSIEHANSNSYEADLSIFSPDRLINATVDYSVVYQSINQQQNCSLETSPKGCFTKCRNRIMERMCLNETFLSNEKNESIANLQKQEWTWQEFINCLTLVNYWVIYNCTEECKIPACVKEMFTINRVVEVDPDDRSSSQVLNIQIQDNIYTLMAEQPVWTRENFIASSGGVLGFWLGLDSTFFILIIFTPLMFIVEVCLKRKTNTTINQEEPQRNFSLLNNFAQMIWVQHTRIPCQFIVKALFERIFWMGVYLGLGILTFKMCSDFYQGYLQSQIAIDYSTIRNQTFKIPEATLCVPWAGYEFREAIPWAKEDELERNFDQQLNSISLTNETIFDENSSWSIDLILIVHQFLTFVEGYKTMEQDGFSTLWSVFNNNSLKSNHFTSLVDSLGVQLAQQNISENKLLLKFGSELRRFYLINITKYVERNGKVLDTYSLEINQTTFVSETKVCFALPLHTISFTSIYEYVSIAIDKSLLPIFKNATCQSEHFIYFTCANCPITVDILGRDAGASTAADSNTLMANFENMSPTTASLSIGEQIQMLPIINGVQRCSAKKTAVECKAECRVDAIKQQCSCSPTPSYDDKHFKPEKDTSDECSWVQLKKCMPYFSTTNASLCIDNCLLSCDHIRYVLSESRPARDDETHYFKFSMTSSNNYCYAEYIICSSSFQYPFFSEKPGWTFYSFIAGFGAILGIWLPLDFVFFVEWFFKFTKWLVTRIYRILVEKKKSKNLKEKPRHSRISRNSVQPIVEMELESVK